MPMRRCLLPLLPLLAVSFGSSGCSALTRPGEDIVPDPTVVAAAAPMVIAAAAPKAPGPEGKVIGVAGNAKGGAAPAPAPAQPPSPVPAGARPQGG
jgi:hypothetical protein